MFVDGPEFFMVLAQLDTEENILTMFQKHPTSGIGGDAITRNVYRRKFGRTEERHLEVSSDLDGCRGALKRGLFTYFPLCSCLNL